MAKKTERTNGHAEREIEVTKGLIKIIYIHDKKSLKGY
jgi:hypothetical protein